MNNNCLSGDIEHHFTEDRIANNLEDTIFPANTDTIPSRNYTIVIDTGHGGLDVK